MSPPRAVVRDAARFYLLQRFYLLNHKYLLMKAKVQVGPFPDHYVEVEVDGIDNKGTPYINCKRCGSQVFAGLMVEVGCPCEYG